MAEQGPLSGVRRSVVDDQARARILRLVDFLKEYDAQKNPPVIDIGTYGLYSLAEEALPAAPGIELTPGGETWLTARFVDLPAKPEIPAELVDFLPDAEQISASETPAISLPASEREVDPDRPDDDGRPTAIGKQGLLAAEEWVADSWSSWSQRWLAAQQSKEFYRRLFEQQALIDGDRETYELVWGFGRVSWSPVDGWNLRHPLFTIVVDVATTADKSLHVRPAEQPLQLETLPFSTFEVADRGALALLRDAVAADPFDPWTTDVLLGEIRQAVRALSHDGVVSGEGAEQPRAPHADKGWVLYTRRRRPDRQGFLDTMRDLYASETLPPDALSSVVVDAPSTYEISDDADAGAGQEVTHIVPDEQLLLPLASNEEQELILQRAQRQSGVVVQGPPGTGKSHTIANLISHYVAYGHRVLVVAEKEQALSVLADKIPAEIRDLTVSVLGSDQSSRQSMEASITSIQAHVAGVDRKSEDRRIAALTDELASLDASIAATTDRLLAARRSETETLAGSWPIAPASPEKAAAWVAGHEGALGYIDDPLPPHLHPPLTSAELAEVVRLLGEIGVQRARETAFTLPPLALLPSGSELATLFRQRDQLAALLSSAGPEIDDWLTIDKTDPAALEALRQQLDEELASAKAAAEPWLAAVADQLGDALLVADWERFLVAMRADREQLLSLRPEVAAHRIDLPGIVEPGFAVALDKARLKLSERGKLGMFDGEAKRALESCRVNGALPASAEAVGLCLSALRISELRVALRTRWDNQVGPFAGPELPSERPEDVAGRYVEQISRVAAAPRRWESLRTELAAMGIRPVGGYGPTTVARLLEVLGVAADRARFLTIDGELAALGGALAEGSRQPGSSPLWRLLADALTGEITLTWQQHRDAVTDLVEISSAAMRLTGLLDRLREAAPLWTESVIADPAKARPATLAEAWVWRQLDTWVCEVTRGDAPERLQRELEALSERRRRLVAELVGSRAWRRLADSLGDRQRQALNGYLAAVKRYGKSGGKFAARWLAAIREALDESKDAVPVWIMTTSRALESFRPAQDVPFDVVIVDEASQIGIDDLPLLALARKAIVVGDDKQTSPAAVGMNQQKVFDLIDSHLAEIPHYRVLFNPMNSLYDIAKQKFPSQIMLREHFRCLPDIIEFSNTTFYEDKIEPLRENRPAPDWAALGAVKVVDGYRRRGSDVNEPEAAVVTELIAKMVDDPRYDDMDFGVISLLAGGQIDLIRKKLFERVGPEVITERRIRVGDAANFQGDERDVILLSTVVGTDPAEPTARMGAMTSVADGQRLNVAASRARNRMVVVHSLDPDRFSASDLRAALIRHCRNPFRSVPSVDDALNRCDSEFERLVLKRIVARGYGRVRSQVRVGTTNSHYRIDLVVDGPVSRLAVECDGERWHGPERWHADRARQVVLERAGWTFHRIRGSAFFRNPDEALEPLWARLEELGIPVGDDWLDASTGHDQTVFEMRGLDIPTDSTTTPIVDLAEEVPAPRRETAEPPPEAAGAQRLRATLPISDKAASTAHEPAPAAGSWAETPPASPMAYPSLRSALAEAPPPTLHAYQAFSGRSLVRVSEQSASEVARGLREIVTAEGPIVARRAYQVYVQASGGQRVGSDIRRTLNKVLHAEIQRGAIAALRDDAEGMLGKTLYSPESAPVWIRQLGPRDLVDVPRSEVARLVEQLGLAALPPGEQVYRAVLTAYGLTRLTRSATEFLQGIPSYEFSV